MKKILFTIPRYNDLRQALFKEHVSPRNQLYASTHGFKYTEIDFSADLPSYRSHPSWYKMWVTRELLNSNKVSNGDIITVLDADMFIVKLDKLYMPKETKSFAYTIDNGNTHCMGSFSIRVNEWTRKLVDNILDDSRYEKYIDRETFHEPSNGHSSFWRSHYEQASWYSLAGIKRHSWESFLSLPNSGFHSVKDEDTVYTLEELDKHVDLLPTEWNVTHDYDSNDRFNINRVKDENVIIRHFAGSQHWDIEKWNRFTYD